MEARAKIEWTLIHIVSLMLVISSFSLFDHVVSAAAAKKHPNLYAPVNDAEPEYTEKIIYFTFDDGPSKNTEKILDVLKEEDVKATFFVTAQAEDKEYAAQLLKRIVDEGHVIGLHSYTHNFSKIYKSADSYLADIDKLNNFIMENSGYRPCILRFPGGSGTKNAKREVMAEIKTEIERRGYVYFDWDIVSGDETVTVYPAENLMKNMIKGAKFPKSAVILAHDNPAAKTTAEAVRMVIKDFREQGYTFSSLSPGVKAKHLK